MMAGRRPQFARLVLLGATFLGLVGCAGYQVGNQSLYPTDVQTVYVPVFESNSFRRYLGERLTEAVIREIETKTPYKVVGPGTADSILRGRILSEGKRVVTENTYDDPRQLEFDVQIEVSWIDRRGADLRTFDRVPLPQELTRLGTDATFVPEVGQSVTTAQQQAIVRAAEQIVGMMERSW